MWIRRYAPPREPSPCKNRRVFSFADMAELADALDLGSSGRPCRFESCYPQLTRIIRTRYPSVMDLEFWFIFERKKARSFDLAFLLCLRFLFICIIFRLRERIVHKYAVLPKKIFLFSGLREISSLWKQDRKYICKVHILLY